MLGFLVFFEEPYSLFLLQPKAQEKSWHSGPQENKRQLWILWGCFWGFWAERTSTAWHSCECAPHPCTRKYSTCRTVSACSYPLGRNPAQKCIPPLSALHWKATQHKINPQTYKGSYEKLWSPVPIALDQLLNQIITPQIKQRAIVTLIFTVRHHKVVYHQCSCKDDTLGKSSSDWGSTLGFAGLAGVCRAGTQCSSTLQAVCLSVCSDWE